MKMVLYSIMMVAAFAVAAAHALAGPLAKSLGEMPESERSNAVLSIRLINVPASDKHSLEAREIERLWNDGGHQQAITELESLENELGPESFELGIDWRTPVPAPVSKWGDDILINEADSVYMVSLANHDATGNLFAIIGYQYSANYRRVSLNFSNDGGQTWAARSMYSSFYTNNHTGSIAVMGDYCYLARVVGAQLLLSRYRASDGYIATFFNGNASDTIYTDPSWSFVGLKLASQWDNAQLYCGAYNEDGRFQLFWSTDTSGTGWEESMERPEYNLRTGLDMHSNQSSDCRLFVSYITQDNRMRVLGLGWTTYNAWDTLRNRGVDDNSDYTAIGAYRDTVLAAYEDTADGAMRVRYSRSYTGGTSWYEGTISSPDTDAWCPDVATREGGGIGVSYIQLLPQQCRFKWRQYSSAWTTYTGISQLAPTRLCQTSVEYMGSGQYGMAYVSAASDLYRAYFDRSNWTGVEGEPRVPADECGIVLEQNFPNPAPRGRTAINFSLLEDEDISLEIFNVLGQKVATLAEGKFKAARHTVNWNGTDLGGSKVASGVYLYQLKTVDRTLTRRMTVVR